MDIPDNAIVRAQRYTNHLAKTRYHQARRHSRGMLRENVDLLREDIDRNALHITTQEDLKNLYAFHFEGGDLPDFIDSAFLRKWLPTHNVFGVPIIEHGPEEPLTIPADYDPDDIVVILAGDKIPFPCHFNFLPKEEGQKQVKVYLMDLRSRQTVPQADHSMINVLPTGIEQIKWSPA